MLYIVPLLESLALPPGISAAANPKSSTGRLDIFTRIITDYAQEFDKVPEGIPGGHSMPRFPPPHLFNFGARRIAPVPRSGFAQDRALSQ